jgi:predicted nucleotidyltransferase
MWYLERKNKAEFSLKEILSKELRDYSLKQILEEIQDDKDTLNDYQKNTIIERAQARKLENPMKSETTERLIKFVID